MKQKSVGSEADMGKMTTLAGRKEVPPRISHMLNEYKRVLASNFVDRTMDGNWTGEDKGRVLSDPKLLAQQAQVEGVSSAKNLAQVERELMSRHPRVSQVARDWLLMLAVNPSIFGDEGSKRALSILEKNAGKSMPSK